MLVRFLCGFRIFVISSDNLVFITSNQYPLFFLIFFVSSYHLSGREKCLTSGLFLFSFSFKCDFLISTG